METEGAIESVRINGVSVAAFFPQGQSRVRDNVVSV